MLRRLVRAAAVPAAALLVACAEPLPPERSAYVGDWRGENMTLLIGGDGRVVYKRIEGRSTTSIEAPLKAFDGDDFSVGVGIFSTRFRVTQPPREGAQGWTMIVDGVELRRVDAGSGRPASRPAPGTQRI